MKKILLFILLQSCFCYGCKSQSDELHFVRFSFAGFKTPNTFCEIDFTTNKLHILQYYFYTKDTVCNKAYTFSDGDITNLKTILINNTPNGIIDKRREEDDRIHDGGGFVIEYKKNNMDTAKLVAHNPERNKQFEKEFLQLDQFFEFAYSIVHDSIGQNALDKAYERYYDGLPIRKIDNNPLQYKIWGDINGCREDNKPLLEFFNNLPKNKCIIVDIGERNLSYCLTEVIAEQIVNSKVHILSGNYLNWLSTELISLRNEVRAAEKNGKVLKETPENSVFLDLYLHDRVILDKWLDLPRNINLETKEEIIKNCH